jgi:hypothetical protein
MKRIVITRPIVGICHMQVCVVLDATDEEILAVANRENPAGTTGGWSEVLRTPTERAAGPIVCADDPGRLHLLLVC